MRPQRALPVCVQDIERFLLAVSNTLGSGRDGGVEGSGIGRGESGAVDCGEGGDYVGSLGLLLYTGEVRLAG